MNYRRALFVTPVALIAGSMLIAGCQEQQPVTAPVRTRVEEPESAKPTAQERAVAAKDALFARLSTRLTKVMQSRGPAAAIDVCSREAGEIAKAISQEHGVKIGRTAIKLRNLSNAPPAWVKPLIARPQSVAQFVNLPGGNTGALLPIKLQSKCIACHGPAGSISDEVKSQLAKQYPRDEATGFNAGDLRGWFWVEVPAESHGGGAELAQRDANQLASVWEAIPARAASPESNPSTPAKVELGKKLFFDPRLSLTGTVSCNSCHNLMEGGDDGRPTSMGIHGRTGPRNAPTVWNSVFQASQFWDGRSPDLEDQAKGPIIAQAEMGMPAHSNAIERIAAIPGYKREFRQVFGSDKSITIDDAVKAIAAFERTLITPNSAFDRFVRGDKSAMSDEQIRGMKLFHSAGCTECHSGPALNGWSAGSTVAAFEDFPRYSDSPFVKQYDLARDLGRFEFTKDEGDKHLFKVPTLRNITLTAPYFHNGATSTLPEAVRVMAETQLDEELTGQEVRNIVAFLTALEGEFPAITMPRLPSRSGESVLENQKPANVQE